MSKFLKTVLVALFSMQCFAQNGNMVFFSEDGFPFRIVMNGVMQNEKAQTNVKVNNLNQGPYKIKVIFDDSNLGAIDDKVNMRPGYEQTYTIKKVKIGDTEKGLKSFGQNAKDMMKTKEEADANQEKIKAQTERWSLKMLSANPIPNNAPIATQTRPTGGQYQQAQQQTVTTTTTTTTPTTGANMNMGINANGMNIGMNIQENDMSAQQQTTTTIQSNTKPTNSGMNMNVNMSGAGMNSTTQTTTTHTTTSTTDNQQGGYVLPGYSGPYGCGYPMSQQEFNDAKKSIESKSFEDSKFTISKQICTKKCLLTSQVKEIMLLFTFEQTRLDFAKFAYGYTYDTGNYYKVNDAFTFETSIDDLNSYIGGR